MMKQSVVLSELLLTPVRMWCKFEKRKKTRILNNFISNKFFASFSDGRSEEKEDVNQSVESTPQMTPIPTSVTAPLQSPSSEQQPEIDEDGYCIQPKDPLWNTQWPKKGISVIKFASLL